MERGEVLRAEKCLSHVHTLAPEQQYIINHLNIVRSKINEYRAKQKTAEAQSKTTKATGLDDHTGPSPIDHDQPSLSQGQPKSGHDQPNSVEEAATQSQEQTDQGETSDGSIKKDEA